MKTKGIDKTLYNLLVKLGNDFKSFNAAKLVEILTKADKEYHNDGIIYLTDEEYDYIKDRLYTKAPKNEYFKKVGAEPSEKLKVKLPYYLGSQDKIKYEDVKPLNNWFSKYNNPEEYVISEKLDGISCLIVCDDNDNENIKIYTRGDGKFGMDISFIKNYIKSIPSKLPKGIAVRGELLLSKEQWEKIKDMGANPRNVVAGLINSKTANAEILPLIDFVVYEVLSHEYNNADSLKYAKSLKFMVVKHIIVKSKLDNDELLEILKDFKLKSKYEIDGIVITHNKKHKANKDKNPEYSFAFKSNLLLDDATVTVTGVEWNVSKDKFLKPIVKFNPIVLNGVSIKQATGFNADFITKNKIGKGSILKIQRSGDVIPHITEVIKSSDSNLPDMPDVKYNWNKTNVDIILDDDDKNREHDIKTFIFFMKTLDIKGISEGIITKLYDNSYDTLYKIMNITKEELLEIDGIKNKSAENILSALSDISGKSCIDLMKASNILGRGLGERKLKVILDLYPFICTNKKRALQLTVEDIKKVNGMGDLSSQLFVDNLNKFYEFYESLGFKEEKEVIKEKPKKTGENNKNIENNYYVFSGFRNKDYEKYITENGGFIDDTIKKNTTHLIVKDTSKTTSKIQLAKEKGIKVISEDDFLKIKEQPKKMVKEESSDSESESDDEPIIEPKKKVKEVPKVIPKIMPKVEPKKEEIKPKETKTETKYNKLLENKHFAFGGIKNKTIEKLILDNNGIIDATVKKDTLFLIVKDLSKITLKTQTANKLKIPIILEDQFIKVITLNREELKKKYNEEIEELEKIKANVKPIIKKEVKTKEVKTKAKEEPPVDKIKIEGTYFSINGIKNKKVEKCILDHKGFITPTVTKKTNYLIVADKTKITKKVQDAIDKNVKIILINEI